MTRKLNILLLLFAIFAVLPFGWLMLDTSTKSDSAKPLTITQLRTLAASLPGPLPREVRYETIGRRRVVSDLLAAGSGLRPAVFAIRAYALVTSDGHVITIDRGMSRNLAERNRIRHFDPMAQAIVERTVANASMSLLLSFEPQHSGSPVALADRAQRPARRGAAPNAPYAAAPGVVVIPADDIRRGERMVYARLSDGQEILFAGDVAMANVSWSEQRPPARLMTSFFVPRDREQIAAWLRTIQGLKSAAPSLQIVPGHDAVLPRVLKRGFATHLENEQRPAP